MAPFNAVDNPEQLVADLEQLKNDWIQDYMNYLGVTYHVAEILYESNKLPYQVNPPIATTQRLCQDLDEILMEAYKNGNENLIEFCHMQIKCLKNILNPPTHLNFSTQEEFDYYNSNCTNISNTLFDKKD